MYPARTRSAHARSACTLRALGVVLAVCPHSGLGEDFLAHRPNLFMKTTWKSRANKRVPFSKKNIGLKQILGVWGGKTYFWPKKYFSAKRKNGRFSVISDHVRCHCGSSFMARTVPPSFVEHSPKLRVLMIAK